MVHSCCAYGCTNRFAKGSGIGFYRFPRNNERRNQWIRAISRENWEPLEETRICGQHFRSGKPSKDADHPDFVPNVFAFCKPKRDLLSFERRQRVCQKRQDDNKNDVTANATTDDTPDAISDVRNATNTDSPVLIDNSSDNQNTSESEEIKTLKLQLKQAYAEIDALRSERENLKTKLEKKNLTASILRSSSKLQFYTSLRSKSLFDYLVSLVQNVENNIKTVSLETQMLIVLAKIKLNLLNTDLAYRFGTSRKTIQRIFDLLIPVLACKLKALIRWPSQDALQSNLPACFRHSAYKDTVCIIDCTEVPIQRPSNMLTRAKTWSNYKHSHTIKFLIGMNPNGAISFLSECWGGRVSDKHITINSGLFEKINPGDVILADRGFIVADYFASKGAKLVVPDYVRGKKQLAPQKVKRSEKISNVRIHIERVIKQMKRFKILHSIIPIRFLDYIDCVTVICAGLCNMSRSIVK